MASSAAQSITGSAHIQALQQKTHHKPAQEKPEPSENFADALAQTDDTQPQKSALPKEQPKEKTARAEHSAAAGAKSEVATEVTEETGKQDIAADAPGTENDVQGPVKEAKAANDNSNETPDGLIPQPQTPEAQTKLKEAVAVAPDSDIPKNQDAPPLAAQIPGGNTASIGNAMAANDAAKPQDTIKPTTQTPANDTSTGKADAVMAQADVQAFEQAVQGTKAEPRPAADAAPPKTEAAKPTADLGTIALAAPAPSAHAAAQTAEKAVAIATPQGPQPPLPNVNQFAVEVAAKSHAGVKQFDIRLDPPELGRVEVRLSIDASGKAEAHLTAEQPATLDLLQKDASVLARALRDAGLNMSQDGLNFSLKNQHQQAGDDGARSQGGRAAHQSRVMNETAETVAPMRNGLSLLDIRV